jgi:hypothetical protein
MNSCLSTHLFFSVNLFFSLPPLSFHSRSVSSQFLSHSFPPRPLHSHSVAHIHSLEFCILRSTSPTPHSLTLLSLSHFLTHALALSRSTSLCFLTCSLSSTVAAARVCRGTALLPPSPQPSSRKSEYKNKKSACASPSSLPSIFFFASWLSDYMCM